MACFSEDESGGIPFVQFALARVTDGPMPLTVWYGGSVVGWTSDPTEAAMYNRRSDAVRLRRALGAGVVVQVYSVFDGEMLDSF